MPKKKKSKGGGGGSKLARSHVVQVRLDPKLKFAAELGARRQRRTLSSYIEWAIEYATKSTHMFAPNDFIMAYHIMDEIWDPDDCLRLMNLARKYPQFLTFEEETTWHLIRQFSNVWGGEKLDLGLLQSDEKLLEEYNKITKEDIECLKEWWPIFQAAGKGDIKAKSKIIEKSFNLEEGNN